MVQLNQETITNECEYFKEIIVHCKNCNFIICHFEALYKIKQDWYCENVNLDNKQFIENKLICEKCHKIIGTIHNINSTKFYKNTYYFTYDD